MTIWNCSMRILPGCFFLGLRNSNSFWPLRMASVVSWMSPMNWNLPLFSQSSTSSLKGWWWLPSQSLLAGISNGFQLGLRLFMTTSDSKTSCVVPSCLTLLIRRNGSLLSNHPSVFISLIACTFISTCSFDSFRLSHRTTNLPQDFLSLLLSLRSNTVVYFQAPMRLPTVDSHIPMSSEEPSSSSYTSNRHSCFCSKTQSTVNDLMKFGFRLSFTVSVLPTFTNWCVFTSLHTPYSPLLPQVEHHVRVALREQVLILQVPSRHEDLHLLEITHLIYQILHNMNRTSNYFANLPQLTPRRSTYFQGSPKKQSLSCNSKTRSEKLIDTSQRKIRFANDPPNDTDSANPPSQTQLSLKIPQRIKHFDHTDHTLNSSKDMKHYFEHKKIQIENLISLFEEQKNKHNADPYQISTILNKELDIRKVLKTLKEVSSIFVNASKLEIDLNLQENTQKKIAYDISLLKAFTEKQKKTIESQKTELNSLRKSSAAFQEENRRLQNQMQVDFQKREQLEKTIRNLEERLEFMLEKNLNGYQDQLHNTLSQLIKENENLKRDVINKKKEIERQKETVGKVNTRIAALQKKLESLKIKRNANEEADEDEFEIKDLNYNINTFAWPSNIDFRKAGLKQEYQQILKDITEHGPEAFAFQIVISEDKAQKRDLSYLISQQYLSYLEFGDRINQLLPKLVSLFKCETVEDIMVIVNRDMKKYIHAEQVSLWLMDKITGYLYTYDSDRNLEKVIIAKGKFQEAYKNGKIVNCSKEENVLLYQSLQKHGADVFGNRVILFPVMNEGQKVCGIISLIKILPDQQYLDEEYLTLIMSKLCNQIIQRIVDFEQLNKNYKYLDLGYFEFLNLCQIRTKRKFVMYVQDFAMKMFWITSCLFLIYDHKRDVFLRYEDDNIQEIEGNIGVAGYVSLVKYQRPFVSMNITKEVAYHSRIDLNCLLPVYCQPILSKPDSENRQKSLGILEFAIKRERKAMEQNHQFPIGGCYNSKYLSVEEQTQRFAMYVSTAYMLCESSLLEQ